MRLRARLVALFDGAHHLSLDPRLLFPVALGGLIVTGTLLWLALLTLAGVTRREAEDELEHARLPLQEGAREHLERDANALHDDEAAEGHDRE
ncbi:MAG: hypothetical protein MUE69_20370 [Myxococcota bacterium]|jgi:hypothetical protein|nr:hypothetical protein [Myxococcota bacterium]